jgi:hypothetical protein
MSWSRAGLQNIKEIKGVGCNDVIEEACAVRMLKYTSLELQIADLKRKKKTLTFVRREINCL